MKSDRRDPESDRADRDAIACIKSAQGLFENPDWAAKVLMSSLTGIYIYDLKVGCNVFINPQYTRLTGYNLEDIQAMSASQFFALFHPEEQEAVAGHFKRISHAGENDILEIEYRFKTADGRWIWCVSRDSVFERDADGSARRLVGTFLDITARKLAEQHLGHQRELLQRIIDTIPVMITIYDPNLQRFGFNNEFREVLGWSEEDIADGDPMEKFYPDEAQRRVVRQYMQSLTPGWRDFHVTAKDGTTVESSWANIRLSDDTQVGIGIDIRKRKRIEEALRASEIETQRQLAELEAIYNTAPVGLCVLDKQLRFVRVNERVAEINGVPVSDHIGRTPREVVPDLADQAERIFQQILETGEPVLGIEISGTTRAQQDLQRTWLEHWLPLKDAEGRVVGINVVAEDVTERKAAARALERSQEELEERIRQRTAELRDTVKALESEIEERKKAQRQLQQLSRVFMDSMDPIIIEDPSGNVIEINWAAEDAYGWKRSELIGKSIKTIIPEERYGLADLLRERCRRGEQVRNWEGVRQDQFGRRYSVLVTAFQLTDESGHPVALATIAKDITERMRMESELQDSRRRLQELSRQSIEALESDRQTVAKELHDSIGAALAAIKFTMEGITEFLASEPDTATMALEKVISQLIDTIKETKRISVKLRPSTLDDLGLLPTINWYMRTFAENYGKVRLIEQIALAEDDIPDPIKITIYRVLQEALNNVGKHSQATTARIRLRKNDDVIELEVEDNGCGFDVRQALSAYDPLSGYGLKSMRERAEICGGSFSVRSQSGQGTLISVKLPAQVSIQPVTDVLGDPGSAG